MEEQIAQYLRWHCTGKARAVTSRVLEHTFCVSGVKLREKVNQLRRQGYPICSDAAGYYYARTKEELDHTISQLFSRSREIAAAATGMMKALPDYQDDGQLRLSLSSPGQVSAPPDAGGGGDR